MKKVQLITDGACVGNPGPGGWACILRHGNQKREMYGYAPLTTNNRMELTAAIEGLHVLNQPCEVEVITDSEYVKNGITQWIHGWKRNNWITSAKKPVMKSDLWRELEEEVNRHKTTDLDQRHAAHDDNNRADELAAMAAASSGQR